MILSIDAAFAFMLSALAATTLLTCIDSFDFSNKEVYAQMAADDIALALQKESGILNALAYGDKAPVVTALVSVKEYCIEITAGYNSVGKCNGQRVTRNFFFYNGAVIPANIAIYFK